MRIHGRWTTLLLVGAGLVLLWADSVFAADPTEELVARVNQRIRAGWKEAQVTPAEPASDAEFLRRVMLDLAGKIPTVSEVRRFVTDQTPDKRQRKVDELLESPRYVVHFSAVWRGELLPEVMADPTLQFLRPAFDAWLRDRLVDNTPYSDIARQLITWPVPTQTVMANPVDAGNEVTPLAFYQAKSNKPENLAGGLARVFLGVRIECAQCHDHPFDAWKQEQFWSLAAFFAEVEPAAPNAQNVVNLLTGQGKQPRRSLTIPVKGTVVEAGFLDGQRPDWSTPADPRQKLADWVLHENNPYFARAAVNRIWGRLMGRGLVDPVDDFSADNAPSHPELLDELATAFREHGYDLKFLLRVLTATEAYQLSSRQTDPSQAPPELFAKMALKGLTPEQIYDSLSVASGVREATRTDQPFFNDDNSPRGQFVEAFSNDSGDGLLDRQTSILQALALMNGNFVDGLTTASGTNTVAAAARFPGLTTAQRVEMLFLAVLSRPPTPEESQRMVAHCEAVPLDDALGDIFWALVNSSEFLFNH